MRVNVIRPFVDKITKIPYNVGYVYESDDIDRIKELQDLGFLEAIPISQDDTIETAILPKRKKNAGDKV